MAERDQQRPWQQPDKIQGLLFDGGMLLANFLILGTLNQVPISDVSDWGVAQKSAFTEAP